MSSAAQGITYNNPDIRDLDIWDWKTTVVALVVIKAVGLLDWLREQRIRLTQLLDPEQENPQNWELDIVERPDVKGEDAWNVPLVSRTKMGAAGIVAIAALLWRRHRKPATSTRR